ncbi:FAD-dependent oxidoreductase [Amycolatopsis sp. NPDC005232]|uniref:NAD(P)/FAD-dependent oxidoreductase n=1 Tax=Amycolatopsis sp. NPDC005232 TaxID=3157027 RepID=UPI0033BD35B9
MRTVIVGASLGGLRTAQAIRAAGLEDSIILIGAEPVLPYDRPPLSKGFLRGENDAGDLALISRDELARLDVDLRLATTATGLDITRQVVELDGGTSVAYDALVIATGCRPRTLPGAGYLNTLRTLDDGMVLRDRLARSASLTVVGGGFIGSEIAATAQGLGLAVTIVEPAAGLMVRAVGEVIGEHLTELHRRRGIDVRTGAGVRELSPGPAGHRIRLTDGSIITAGTIVAGIGAIPATGWLEGSGLRLADGVVCGPDLRADGTTNVFAVGDVARWRHPRYPRDVRAEHWTAVAEHARVVAANLAGGHTVADSLPYVWSDQFGARLQIAGAVPPDPTVEYAAGGPGSERFVALLTDGTGVQAVAARGALREFLAHRGELDRRTAVTGPSEPGRAPVTRA